MKKVHSNIFLIGLCLLMASITYATPKNFIIILTDDQGYGDLSSYGSTIVDTPNIDQMATEGMRLTDFYVASSICSPSRAALLTGRMPVRVGVTGVYTPRSTDGLQTSEITIAELLKSRGYVTGIVGKWHLGHKPEFMPMNQGFDSNFGMPFSNDMSIADGFELSPTIQFNDGYDLAQLNDDIQTVETKGHRDASVINKVPLLRGNEIIEYPVDQRTLTRRYTEESLVFIEANKDQPFFLYLAHTMPHKPYFIEAGFAGKSAGDVYGDIIEHLDWSVGQILRALRNNGLEDNTLVLFTSDNGPIGSGSAGPLRGQKFTTYEGGMRVPAIFWGPGTVEAGKVCKEIVSALDLFPTIAYYAQAQVPEDRTYDGYNVANLLEGTSERSPRNEIYYYGARTTEINGMRIGDWKYLEWGSHPRNKPKVITPTLYNLRDDIEEEKNLINQYPEIRELLMQRMDSFDSAFQ